ncbi:hypothetical protein G3480_11935 [Thiorhodococcus mannitoliphagus]|uniref:SPOR domain-containing protein n=1 Tax=Thiorhodococcus mannitoliphagus TaxID=329406 RepID=A0A6P1DUY9_9GAMM|nr:SPOR domain-containing protein [Thiorhodococcus mannitoliphagus]NEX21013.1 hypothetical protein [Thiorhodococcus mannitoliphagus]
MSAAFLVLVGALIVTSDSAKGEWDASLSKPSLGDDPAWLEQLPEVVLPLPKLLPQERPMRAAPGLAEPDLAEPDLAEEDMQGDEATSAMAGAEDSSAVQVPESLSEPDAPALGEALPLEESAPVGLVSAKALPAEVDSPPEDSIAPEELAVPIEPLAPSPEVVEVAAAKTPAVPTGSEPIAGALDYRWQVQLLAGRSRSRVESDRDLFARRYASMLEGLTLEISRPSFGDARDDFFRLRALDWASQSEAVAWCERLRARGHECMVTRVIHFGE